MTLHTSKGPVSAILFDLDGTLIDSAPDLGAAADALRIRRGLSSLPDAMYRPFAGAGARGMLRVAFGLEPEAPEFVALREEFFSEYEQRMTQRTYLFDGVVGMLKDIQALGMRWGVVTNKSQRFTGPLTAHMPVFASASVIVSGDTTPHAKPHPAPLLEAARRLDVVPSECVYVGDDERDIVAARAAGMVSVAACYGYLGAEAAPSRWGADVQIKSPEELLQSLAWT